MKKTKQVTKHVPSRQHATYLNVTSLGRLEVSQLCYYLRLLFRGSKENCFLILAHHRSAPLNTGNGKKKSNKDKSDDAK